jgi:hypothetical protein
MHEAVQWLDWTVDYFDYSFKSVTDVCIAKKDYTYFSGNISPADFRHPLSYEAGCNEMN